MREVALCFEGGEGADHLLDGRVARNPRGLEKVHLLKSAEGLVDRLDAAPQVLGPTHGEREKAASQAKFE